jgi:hypothetical protein
MWMRVACRHLTAIDITWFTAALHGPCNLSMSVDSVLFVSVVFLFLNYIIRIQMDATCFFRKKPAFLMKDWNWIDLCHVEAKEKGTLDKLIIYSNNAFHSAVSLSLSPPDLLHLYRLRGAPGKVSGLPAHFLALNSLFFRMDPLTIQVSFCHCICII